MRKSSAEMFSPTQVTAAHDAAHELNDSDLHELAVSIMEAAGLSHIGVDDLDEVPAKAPHHPLPKIIPIAECAVAQMENGDRFGDIELGFNLGPRFPMGFELGDFAGSIEPLYDLCLVRRETATKHHVPGVVPGVPVALGPVRTDGVFKFPVCAQRFDGDLVQVHHDGAIGVAIYEDGSQKEVCVEMSTAIGARGVYLGVSSDAGITLIDRLEGRQQQIHLMEVTGRIVDIPEAFRAETHRIESPSELSSLPPGRWLIRWVDEIVDFEKPHWYVYHAQCVHPGQFVKPMGLTNPLEMGDGLLTDETFACRLHGGLRAQVHVRDDRVWVFAGERPIDMSPKFGQVCEAMRQIDVESFVVDGELTGPMTGNGINRQLAKGCDLSEWDVSFQAFDCLYYDGDDIHEMPLIQRLAKLNHLARGGLGVLHQTNMDEVLKSEDGAGSLIRAKSSTYLLCGTPTGWFYDKDIEEVPDPITVEPVDERPVSRAWVSMDGARVEQSSEPVRFVYHRRYDGMLMPDEAGAAINSARLGEVPPGLASLDVPMDDLRNQYRVADWRKRGKIVSRALGDPTDDTPASNLVARVAVTGELHVEAPQNNSHLLSLSMRVVNDGIQHLVSPHEVAELGQDTFAASSIDDKWLSSQIPPQSSSWLDEVVYADAQWRDGSRFHMVLSGQAILGTQKHDFHEMFLMVDGDPAASGRYVWSLVEMDGSKTWLGRKPDEQTPYVFKHDQDAEVAKAAIDHGWIAWNPEGVRAIANSALSDLLPFNWEAQIESYDDEPFVDFAPSDGE